MAVDEQYVEEVRNEEDFDDILAEMGISAHYKPASDNGLDLVGYDVYFPKDLIVGERYIGKPILTDVFTEEFESKYTGEITQNHRLELVLRDDNDKEAYIGRINLKEAKNVWENPHPASGLYKLAISLMELRVPGISRTNNALDVVDIKKLQKYVAKYETMTFKIIENSFKDDATGEVRKYNTFIVVGGKLAE